MENLHPFVCRLRIFLSLVSLHSNTDLVVKKKKKLKRIYTRKLYRIVILSSAFQFLIKKELEMRV